MRAASSATLSVSLRISAASAMLMRSIPKEFVLGVPRAPWRYSAGTECAIPAGCCALRVILSQVNEPSERSDADRTAPTVQANSEARPEIGETLDTDHTTPAFGYLIGLDQLDHCNGMPFAKVRQNASAKSGLMTPRRFNSSLLSTCNLPELVIL